MVVVHSEEGPCIAPFDLIRYRALIWGLGLGGSYGRFVGRARARARGLGLGLGTDRLRLDAFGRSALPLLLQTSCMEPMDMSLSPLWGRGKLAGPNVGSPKSDLMSTPISIRM